MGQGDPGAQFEAAARRVGRWARRGVGPRWVVAVSGGSDSVGLLRWLADLAPSAGLELSVAHLDHGARGEAARLDAAFVADLADRLGLPADFGRWAPARAGHFEADARRARYAWLAEVATARGAAAVAVGHTRDDQAETVLHRVIRGTGPRGLAGIPPRRRLAGPGSPWLVRPLLGVTRAAIRGRLEALGQPWREDASNLDAGRTRARIRHDLLPRLAADSNPKVSEALARLADLCRADESARRRRVARLAARAVRAEGEALAFDRGLLAGLAPVERAEVIRLAWRRAGWPEGEMTAGRWRRLAALMLGGPARSDVGGGVEARLSGGSLVLVPGSRPGVAPPPAEPVALPVPGSVAWGGGRLVATLDPGEPRDETVDLDALGQPLCVRAPAEGDRFAPLGMGGRSRPLNDVFRGRGVPRAARAGVPLVCDDRGIVWVVGHRIAERVKLTAATARRLGLRWEPGPGGA